MTDKLTDDLSTLFSDTPLQNCFLGVRVEKQDSGEVLFDLNGSRRFTPASNTKILTTGAALDLLGPDLRFKTRLLAIGQIEEGKLRGDLVIEGSGDPTLGSRRLEEGHPSREVLSRWVASIRTAGIESISGTVVADGRIFDDEYYSLAWDAVDLFTNEATTPAGVAMEENGFRFRILPGSKAGAPGIIEAVPKTGYYTIINRVKTVAKGDERTARIVHRNPEDNEIVFGGEMPLEAEPVEDFCHLYDGPRYAAHLLHEALQAAGVTIEKGPANIQKYPGREILAAATRDNIREIDVIESPPISEIIAMINKPSNNFVADMMLKNLGVAQKGEGSYKAGVSVVREWLEKVGIPDLESVNLHDGSGLARRNFLQPRQVCAVLRYLYKDEGLRRHFYPSLPIAGVGEGLKNRMTKPPLQGNVHAKTGWLPFVRALSGYVTNASGETLIFSIIANGYTITKDEMDQYIDKTCLIMAEG